MLRRDFIRSGFGAGLGVALGARLDALAGDKFRWAMSSHMFTPLKPHPEMGIRIAAKFGFHGIEPWGNELQKYLTQPPQVFKQVLDESGIGISSVASGESISIRRGSRRRSTTTPPMPNSLRISASPRSRPTLAGGPGRRT